MHRRERDGRERKQFQDLQRNISCCGVAGDSFVVDTLLTSAIVKALRFDIVMKESVSWTSWRENRGSGLVMRFISDT